MIIYEEPSEIEEENKVINDLITGKPFLEKKLLINEQVLRKNSKIVEFRKKYERRPDLLAFEQYGISNYYPILLFANGVGSLFQFTKDNLNNECVVPDPLFIEQYLI